MKNFKQLSIIGSTASGKTSLAIKVAHKIDAYILSLDSLSVYKEIDIVSAKPTKEEQQGVKHFGINCLYPDEVFDVTVFITLYQEVYEECLKKKKNLVIVGGTGFYLKMLLEGVSPLPNIAKKTQAKTAHHLCNLQESYGWLCGLDEMYMSKIKSNDSYRIEKALNIYFETNFTPSEYFAKFPPIPTIKEPLPIYQIVWDKKVLHQRIMLRTEQMLKNGLIDYNKTTEFAEKIINDYGVKTPNAEVPAGSLSGGNLQKFIIGRELNQNPTVLIVAQPTWGVDAGAAQTIRQSIRELAASGSAVLVISQDLDELIEITDRIGAICGGVVSQFYPTSEMSVEKVGMLMAGVSLEEGVDHAA